MLVGVGQRNRHRTSSEVENRKGIQGVAVGPDNASLTNRREVTAVPELAKSSALGDESKIDIGLGAIVVVNGDRHSRARRCLRTCNGAYCSQRQGHPNGRRDVFHPRSEEHTSELQSRLHLVCRLLLEKKKKNTQQVSCSSRPLTPLLSSSSVQQGDFRTTSDCVPQTFTPLPRGLRLRGT